MHENSQKALRLIDQLVAGNVEAAFNLVYSEFPDLDKGPDEAYEAKINAEYNMVLDEIGGVMAKRYGAPLQEPPSWANLRCTAWPAGEGMVFAFLERDDWDAPLSIVIGRSHSVSHEMDEDPWSYERKEI